MKQIYLILGFLILGWEGYAQKENYVWYFGYGAGLDFNSGSAVALTNSNMSQLEGCSSIADANGNLLFYTDGGWVWDKNHMIMPNGDTLGGHFSSTQSAIIIPDPGNNLLYYIFTVGGQFSPNKNFSYSIVDMSMNNGNGDVTLKNVLINTQMSEKLTAVKHSNNHDIWVMVHGVSNNSLYCYLVTDSGIAASPVTSILGSNFISFDFAGQMKFSPDGTKIAFVAAASNYVDLFDFNSTTGTAINEKTLTFPIGSNNPYGLEFSVNSNFLYATTIAGTQGLFQWDISSNSAAIINSTLQQVAANSSMHVLGSLQLGPDEKIYVAVLNSTYLSVINNPEMPGLACNFLDSAVSLDLRYSKYGLPNFIASYFLPTGFSSLQPLASSFQIFPNPATSTIQITFNTKHNTPLNPIAIGCEIVNVMGEKVFSSPVPLTPEGEPARIEIDVSFLAKGIYFIKVRYGKKEYVKKLMIQ